MKINFTQMKIVISIIIVLFFFLVNSCKEPQDVITVHTLVNKSNIKIRIQTFYLGALSDSVILDVNEIISFNFSNRAGEGGLPFHGDSLKLFYNDTISITHFRTESQVAARSLLLKKSWDGGKTGDYEYRYEYVFTNADYEEALEN